MELLYLNNFKVHTTPIFNTPVNSVGWSTLLGAATYYSEKQLLHQNITPSYTFPHRDITPLAPQWFIKLKDQWKPVSKFINNMIQIDKNFRDECLSHFELIPGTWFWKTSSSDINLIPFTSPDSELLEENYLKNIYTQFPLAKGAKVDLNEMTLTENNPTFPIIRGYPDFKRYI